MKLTTYQKEGIVKAIMADVPKPSGDKITKEMQEALVKAMSPAARKLYRECPQALRKAHVYSDEYGTEWSRDLTVGDANLAETLEPWKTARSARRDAERKLAAAVKSCNTLKQLQSLLPEFIKYFPTEEQPTKNLPAVQNVVADLSKLGWPKGGAV